MARATRQALHKSAALHCDCQRDARLAREWGFPIERPLWILPGNGGVDESVFRQGPSGLRQQLGIPEGARLIVNPRGIREYVRTDIFFRALPEVLARLPDVHVICPGMASSRYAKGLMEELNLSRRVHLLPVLDHHNMAEVFRAARVSVSLSTHDGTPNTLLEGMACGTFPVVGDVESVREWVREDRNGLVVPAENASAVSAALLRALTDDNLVLPARERNLSLIRQRASYGSLMRAVEERYESVVIAHRNGPRSGQ